jgi:hypothetical protein
MSSYEEDTICTLGPWGIAVRKWLFTTRPEAFWRILFSSHFPATLYARLVTAETFSREISEAMKAYDRFVVCIDKTPDEFQQALLSLVNKAIKAYESRGPNLRHGIALDRHVTVILSQNEAPRPLCGIYFNLHSPYQKPTTPVTGKSLAGSVGGAAES